MIFGKVHLLFRIQIHNLKLRIRILQKVSGTYESGSTTLLVGHDTEYEPGLRFRLN
jgi:hypothetical protein